MIRDQRQIVNCKQVRKHEIESFPTQAERSLFSLVENRTVYSYDQCELNFFETHQVAEKVELRFDHFVLTSMLRGKKVMHLAKASFDYLPGESVILPPGELMSIDFPEAHFGNPTQCLALTISDDVIHKTVEILNENYTKAPTWGQWEVNPDLFHLTNNQALADAISRIVRITKDEEGRVKDVMVNLTLQEMLVRLMQTQAKVVLNSAHRQLASSNALAAAVSYIHHNLRGEICYEKLAETACMSRASFYKKFKETMGETPAQYILKERIKLAQKDLCSKQLSVTEVCFATGFKNLSHFVTSFKDLVGLTPKAWQEARGQ